MAAHPLDPLSPTEFQSTAAILRRDQGVTDSWRFASIELKEPAKADVKAWRPGDPVPRRSFSVLLGPADQPDLRGCGRPRRRSGGLLDSPAGRLPQLHP